VTSLERVGRPAAWADPPAAIRFVLDAWTIAEGELRKLRHDPHRAPDQGRPADPVAPRLRAR